MKQKGYLPVGLDRAIGSETIVGIFDLDTCTVKKDTRDFLSAAEKSGCSETVTLYDLPLSFVVCAPPVSAGRTVNQMRNLHRENPSGEISAAETAASREENQRVVISPVSAQTLLSRAGKIG